MNKEEIISRLKALPYDPEDYCLLFETAKVMRGLVGGAGGIHLGCSSEVGDRMLADGARMGKDAVSKKGFRLLKIDRDIMVSDTDYSEEYGLLQDFDWIDGFRVPTEDDLKAMDELAMYFWGLVPDMMGEFCSEHYVFHYWKDSAAERDIQKIAEKQEACFRQICDTLKVEPDFRIQYYLMRSVEETARIYGAPVGGFASAPDKVFAVYNETRKVIGPHEDTHLLSRLAGDPDSDAVSEGLSVWFDRNYNSVDNLAWVIWFLQTGKYLNVQDLLDNDYFAEQSEIIKYPLMAAFTGWLIDGVGMDRYLKFLKYKDSREGFRDIYGKTAEELNELFVEYAKQYHFTDEKAVKRIEWVFRTLSKS